jgi:carbon-monoxide dehydrogenase medium subunit
MLIGLRSRKHIPPFDLVRPTSIEECCAWLARPGRTAVLAGGLDLIDRMKTGEVFDTIIAPSAIAELTAVRDSSDEIVVGALTTHADVANNPIVGERLPDLANLWRRIANPRVRWTGTIGGNLVSALPHYDALPALLALGATATVATSASGQRRIALSEPIGRNELLVGIQIPASLRARLLADRSLHPTVAVYLGADVVTNDIAVLRVAVGGAYERAPLVTLPYGRSRQSLGADAAALAQRVVAELPAPMADGLASSNYRRRMIEVLTRRLLIRLGSEP